MIHATKRSHWVLTIVVVLAIATAACSASDTSLSEPALLRASVDRSESAPATPRAPDRASAPISGEKASEPATDELGSGGVTPIAVQAVALGRDIIYTADLVVAVTDVAAAGEEATRIVAAAGGFLFGQQTTGAPEPRSTLIFKVQPEDFQDTLTLLGGIGEVRTQTVSADDVTERVVDLESRIKTAEASVTRLQGFLAEATDIATIAILEAELLQRETDLETLRGQLRTIQDRVDLAAITLTLTEAVANPQIRLVTTAYPGADDAGASCPGTAKLTITQGEAATLCFRVMNVGDTALSNFKLSDTVLDVELDDLVVAFGNPAVPLQPGQSFMVATETTADQDITTRSRVTATAINQDGTPIEGRTVANTSRVTILAADPGGIPGFQDGLTAAWELLVWMGGVVVLLAGLLLPFLWVPIVLWLVWLWRRKRDSAPQAAPEAEASDEDREGELVGSGAPK